MSVRLLLVEPPKDYWFLMGEYLPPPTALLTLAAYVERECPGVDIDVLDCQAEVKGWDGIRDRIDCFQPDIIATSGYTCNAYVCARVAEIAKNCNPDILTVVGGQHFTALPEESLLQFPEIDMVVRGEGEAVLAEIIRCVSEKKELKNIAGTSQKHNDGIIHNPAPHQIENLDALPYPAYHLVEKNLREYHFTIMAGKNARYMIMEGSRGCRHKCTFCTQWRHWKGTCRAKSAKRIADEFEHLRDVYGAEFIWLTDDNFEYATRGRELIDEFKNHHMKDEVSWFLQARVDEIAGNPDIVAGMGKIGNTWNLIGIENHSKDVLRSYQKQGIAGLAHNAVGILKKNNIFSHGMFVIGSRSDNAESITELCQYASSLNLDLAIFTILTPYPGTDIYREACSNGWIEDTQWSHYDMAHAIMPTEKLTRREVQEQLYLCYRSYYGSVPNNIKGFFSKNKMKRRVYRHMAGKFILSRLRRMI